MEKLLDYLDPKTFGRVHYVAVIFWILISIVFVVVFSLIENNESRLDFRCGGAINENIELVTEKCYEKYTEQYNKIAFPIYGFFIINFFVIGFVCVLYSRLVKPKVEQVSRRIRNDDPERQLLDQEVQETASSAGYNLLKAYICQLLIRLVLGVIFIIVQTQFLYPLKFPSKFNCYLTDGTTQPKNSSDTAQNSTLHECHNQRAAKKTFSIYAVLAMNGIHVAGILIEIVYIFSRASKDSSFMQDSKFLKTHLNFSHDKSRQEPHMQGGRNEQVSLRPRVHNNPPIRVELLLEPPRQDEALLLQPRQREHRPAQVKLEREPQTQNDVVPPQPRDQIGSQQEVLVQRGPERLQDSKLEIFITETKKIIKEDTQKLFELRSPFAGHPGAAITHLTLDQIYTNLVVVSKLVTYNFTSNRQEQLRVYPISRDHKSGPKSPEELLNVENKKVLIVGRAGIGKTFCCTKFLRDWAFDQGIFEAKIHFDAAFFVKFRRFDSENDLTLRELLARSEYSPSDHLDDEVWQHIQRHSEGVLILFDGFDEFKLNMNIVKPRYRRQNIEQKMPLQILYQWLVTGKLLKEASILTTTRPTALSSIAYLNDHFDKTFEIIGFSREQIEEYVYKFAGDDKETGETLWRHISSNMNLLSLCYIPVNSFIMCSSLSQMLQFENFADVPLPSKLTTIYKIAVKVFYFKHTKELRDNDVTRKQIESDHLPAEVEAKFKRLGRVAFEGIKEGKLILGGNEVRGMEDSALFHRLPDRQTGQFKYEEQFCFIHLTMQEFFAARHMVNTMSKRKLKKFVSTNIKDGKWQLVFQFLAGLMNDNDQLSSKIFLDLLPVKTTKEKSYFYEEDWPENEEKKKVTIWPTEDKREITVTLLKCINESVNESESSNMESVVKRKLQQINCDFVKFNSCHLTAVDCASIVNVIKNVHKISLLDLSDNNLHSLGCLEICKLLKCSHSQLSWLNLRGNQLKDEGAKYLADAITSNNCQLRKLNLTGNYITATAAQHLAHAITNNNCQLRELNLEYNNITATGAQHLAHAITHNNCQLRELNLTNNNITDTGAQHLADAITSNNCQLRTLNLSLNNITDTGAQHLADAITSNNCQLHTLNLRYNNITEAGKQHALNLVSNSQSKCKLEFYPQQFQW